MKTKKLLCALIAVCMLIPTVYITPVFAADEWIYSISSTTADAKDATTKKGAIQATLHFKDGDAGGNLDDKIKERGKTAKLQVTTSYAPWTLESLELKNNTKDGYKIFVTYVYAKKVGGTYSKCLLLKYPGDEKDTSSGTWIDQDDGNPVSYTTTATRAKREISALGNFEKELHNDFFLSPNGEKANDTVEHKWNGYIKDNYSEVMKTSGNTSGQYKCMDFPDAPKFKISISGKKGDGANISQAELEKNGFTFYNDTSSGYGYKFDRKKAADYMNQNNVYGIEITFKLDFPSATTSAVNVDTTAKTYIARRAFTFDTVRFSTNYYYAMSGNYFYNSSEKKINIGAYVKTNGSSAPLGYGRLDGATIYFDKAYIKAGDNVMLTATDESGKPITSAKLNSVNAISLDFPYSENLDSENSGITLVFENARMRMPKLGGNVDYYLWDETNHKLGFANQSNFDGFYASAYKIDSKKPTVALSAANGVDLNKWNKTVTLTSVPSEELYYHSPYTYLTFFGMKKTVEIRTQGSYKIKLVKDGVSPVIYKTNYTEQNKSGADTTQLMPAAKNFAQEMTLALRDKVEGEFDLVISGEDFAGNKLDSVFSGIKLDNKAPEITVTETVKPKIDGKKGNIYDVKISDASGTGKFYYMFTKKSILEIPEYDGSGTATSGDIDTTLDKWAFIDQKDTENGKTAAAYLNVDKGENFIGHLVYFAEDEAGNRTDVTIKDININNEDTTYDITPKNLDKPLSSYNISVTTNGNNTVYYRWKNYVTDEETGKIKENYITDFKLYNGIIDTSKDAATKSLNGTYTLECKIVPPSGTNINYTSVSYVFDNAGPVINLTSPAEDSYKPTQTVAVYATDISDIASATAKIVTPDGKDIDGNSEFALSVSNGILSQNVNVSTAKNGAYALKVTATDKNGLSSTEISAPFFVRNTAPTGTVDVASSIKHNGKSLISSEKFKLDFDISEDFANSSSAKMQKAYYRISTVADEYGEWLEAGSVTSSGTAFNAKFTVDAPEIALVDGENTLFVQTALAHGESDKSKIDLSTVRTDEIVFYFDNTAPEATLVMDDIHTNKSISGKIYVSDNVSAAFSAVCTDSAVQIGEFKDGAFDITVSDNVDTTVTVSDEANNKAYVKVVIKGIDTEPPTADITVSEKISGARKDAAAIVKLYDVSGTVSLGGTSGNLDVDDSENADKNVEQTTDIKFAFIPTNVPIGDKAVGEKIIPDEYFKENLANNEFYRVSQSRIENGEWEGEYNIIYNVEISGITDSRLIGVRASDSLGNTTDIIFPNPLTSQDADLTAEISVAPMRTVSKTVAKVAYNVPVYTLPQDKIVDAGSDIVKNNTLEIEDFENLTTDEKVETANLELAKKYALSYSDKYNFAASRNGNYDLYTVDDLGRTKHLTVEVAGVEFNAPSEIKAGVFKREGTDETNYTYTPFDAEKVCAANLGYDSDINVVVESAENDGNTLFLPNEETDDKYTNGLEFNAYYSKPFAVYSREPSEDDPFDRGEIKGYTKLVYRIQAIEVDDGSGYMKLSDATERIVNVFAFDKDADPAQEGQKTEKTAVLSGIDNDAPVVEWSVNPEVLVYEPFETDGEIYYELVPYTTPGNVTYTIRAQDKESGINKIMALGYMSSAEDFEEVYVPMTDANGSATEYWCWDGSQYTEYTEEFDEKTGDIVSVQRAVPVKVEYFGDGDIYAEKMLTYTFTDAYTLKNAGIFFNTLEASNQANVYYDTGEGGAEGGLSTVGIIYKMPIEEGKDYNIKYYFEDAEGNYQEIDDIASTYYKNAKAVIELTERGEKRGLTVTNNSRSSEKYLNYYQNEFTFSLKDKFNYTAEAFVSLSNFDTVPGTIEYALSTSNKTNTDIDVNITLSDAMSGPGTVKLAGGADEISLTKTNEYEKDVDGTSFKFAEYTGKISKNGTYSITMLDNVGNKSVKSFNISNINKDEVKAEVSYSTQEYTSRPVNATLTFNKSNVRITSIEPVSSNFTDSDYSVNYNTSVITFTKSGSLSVFFKDDYGNEGSQDVVVGNIDKTPPTLDYTADTTTDPSVVSVTFKKPEISVSPMDAERKETDIFVTYGGMTKQVVDEKGNRGSFVFYENGNYTFKIHDTEGRSSFLTITIDNLDKAAPTITSVKWTYEYDTFNGTEWITQTESGSKVPKDGTAGYVVGTAASENSEDKAYPVTNKDVTVTVETDSDTRLAGSTDEYNTVKEKVYNKNGLFIFNTEKKNGLTASYGVDIEVIDKTAPTIDISDLGGELVFYENPEMNSEYDISMIKYVKGGKYTAYKAYDVFNGKTDDLTEKVEVDFGEFNPNDLSLNKFDSSKPYTITYTVYDAAHNQTTVTRTVRLVGKYDTVALVNGSLPDFAGRSEVLGKDIKISLANFSGTAYVRYQSGIKTMGEMKKDGTMTAKDANGNFEVKDLSGGWYTFYIQTDKRDYFTLCVYLSN